MIKRTVVATIGALAVATGAAYADTGSMNAQIHNLQMQINQLQNQIAHGGAKGAPMMGGLVSTNPQLSQMMLNNQQQVGNEMVLLNARKNGQLANGLTLGGAMEADAFWQHANNNATGAFLNPAITDSVFTGGYTGSNATQITLTALRLQFIANINDWTTAYAQVYKGLIGTPSSSATVTTNGGATLSTSNGETAIIVPQAYLLFGNLANNPVYGFIGRKDINFGQFSSVMNYIQPLNRILFQANGDVAGVGYSDYGFNAVVSAMNGGNQTGIVNRTSMTQFQNLNTTSSGNIQNFALNAGYGMTNNGVDWHIGGGLLRGSAFSNNSNQTNGAWDINGKVSYANFDLLGEFTRTFQQTQDNSHVNAWQIAGDYNFPIMGHKSVFSLSYSAETGDNKITLLNLNTSTGPTVGSGINMQQYAVGLRSEVLKNVSAGVEYAYDRENSALTGSSNWNTVLLDVTAMF